MPTCDSLEARLKSLLRVDLRRLVPEQIEKFLLHVENIIGKDVKDEELRRGLSPIWVVLAAGKGSRIDRTGRLNKNLDIWFGAQNTLRLACRLLPGNRAPIIVVNKESALRVLLPERRSEDLSKPQIIPDEWLDVEKRDLYFGKGSTLALQPVPNGTGGAMRAAEEALEKSDAEFVGVAFGDEPFLDARLFAETFVEHFISGVDATLCGKKPESVMDKGGLFFDDNDRLKRTKEWLEMTPEEREWMLEKHKQGSAITNTGFSLLRRNEVLKRFEQLPMHRNRAGLEEYHHVDFFNLFYNAELRTHAYVYQDDIRSGINRWENVYEGEKFLDNLARQKLAQGGVRVHPNARITFESDIDTFIAEKRLGVGCVLSGRVHLGARTTVKAYSYLEDAVLTGETTVGMRTRIVRSTLHHVRIADSDDETPIGAPVRELATLTELVDCTLERTVVGERVQLDRVSAQCALIPAGVNQSDKSFGVKRDPALELPNCGTPCLHRLVPVTYKPGVYTFRERRGTPDYERLREYLLNMVKEQIAARATSNSSERERLHTLTFELLHAEFEGEKVADALTPEELWGILFELTSTVTGCGDPYWHDKRRSRGTAFQLAEKLDLPSMEWDALLRLDIAANLIDFSSARMIERMVKNPNYLEDAAQLALDTPLAIDSSRVFLHRLIDSEPKCILWLTDNDGEVVFDLWVIGRLLDKGHSVVVAAKSVPANNDATVADVRAILNHPCFNHLRTAEAIGDFRLIGSGSNTVGTNLYRATPEFAHVLREADIVISKGQGNWYTTQGLRRDVFYLFTVKGETAERSTGVTTRSETVVPPLICAYVRHDSDWKGTLKEFAVTD